VSALTTILRGRRRAAPLALGLALLAVVGVGAVTLLGESNDAGARRRSSGGKTAKVERRTLVERETVDGTLGYSGHRTVVNRLAASAASDSPNGNSPAANKPAAWMTPDNPNDDSGDAPNSGDGSDQSQDDQPNNDDSSPDDSSDDSSDDTYTGTGTLTSMARAGSVVHRGGALYRLDGDPIVLMYGSTPAYRTLKQGVADGADVRELEANLAELGFDPGTVDDTYSSSTSTAVSAWQKSQGLDETGTVLLGRVVFMPGPRRIGQHKAALGTVLGAGAEVLDTSSTKRVVTVPLDATKQSLAKEGAAVTVTLPDGSVVRGKISNVGRVAREEEGDSSDPNAEKALVIDVTVVLRSDRGIGRLDEAPVGVGLAEQARRHVLSVPVNALLARRGGGYAVELAGSHRLAPVEAGLFADGYVEVSGRAVSEGTRVVVPSE
jgi:peptidoglycan hydrolase-like protein with peptidoglycan-binding domain